jgi:hypothetical protein
MSEKKEDEAEYSVTAKLRGDQAKKQAGDSKEYLKHHGVHVTLQESDDGSVFFKAKVKGAKGLKEVGMIIKSLTKSRIKKRER